MKKFKAKDFLRAFKSTWESEMADSSRKENILTAYRDHPAEWTKYMLKSDSFFLKKVHEEIRLNLDMAMLDTNREYSKLDVIYSSTANIMGDKPDAAYPAGFDCVIEHENGNKIEEEMYKLIFWRAPLKVVIFYDHGNKKQTHDEWPKEKIVQLNKMLIKANKFWHENEKTEYLLLWANWEDNDEIPVWKCFILTADSHPTDIAKKGIVKLTDSPAKRK